MARKISNIGEKKEVTVVIRRPVMNSVLYEMNESTKYSIGEYFCHAYRYQDLITTPPAIGHNFIGGYGGYTIDNTLDAWGTVY